MTNLNKVILQGCLTKDAELKKTSTGKTYSSFIIVVNRDYKNGETWTEKANFFYLTLWGARAENLTPYLKRGLKVNVEGYLDQNRYEKNGIKESRTEVRIEKLFMLSKSMAADNIPAPAVDSAFNSQEEAKNEELTEDFLIPEDEGIY